MATPRPTFILPSDTPALLDQVRVLVASPAIPSNAVSGFVCRTNAGTGAVDVTFSLADATGVSAMTLLRAAVLDAAVAVAVQSWSPASVGDYAFPDSAALAATTTARAYYWIELAPMGTTGASSLVGPVSLALNPSTATPSAPTAISAGHGPATNSTVPVYVTVSGVDPASSIRVYVTGYQGNSGAVLVASAAQSPLAFTLNATGETVTVYATTVSASGVESAASPSTTLTLTASATVPPTPPAPSVTQIPSGNQLTFPASPDPSVTTYTVYRGARTDAPASYPVLATVTATGSSTITYLDTAGLTGDFAYTLSATSPTGTSLRSPAGSPAVILSSAALPPNTASIAGTNTATVDSVNNGGSALIRVYGPGGIGTSYTEVHGYGSLTRPNGTVSGLQLKTPYVVVFDTVQKAFLAFLQTQYPSSLPDGYAFVGYHTTLSSGPASGSGATATAVVGSSATVVQVNVQSSGSGYSSAEVDFSGGGGSGAQATANISTFGGHISSITVTNGGTGYATAPTVTIVATNPGQETGGGGSSPIYNGGARYQNQPPQ